VADYVLEAQPRAVTGKKVGQLRTQGIVPIVVYGPRTETVHLQVPYRPLEVALMKVGGTSLIDITADGKTHTVLAREVQRDLLRGKILHVDFFAVDMSATIRAEVFIHLQGESPAVNQSLGIMVQGTNRLTIETLPSNLIQVINVDITGLEQIGDAIHVRDLSLGEGITIINDQDELIVRISQTSAARSEEDEEGAAAEGAATSAEPEVIGRGKKEEEEE
jgi:large subunit ribosomal protein L25